jgi:hypothetical protein
MTKNLLLAGEHARADSGNGIVAKLRHSACDHRGDSGWDASFVFRIDDPAIDTCDDLMRLLTRRC